MTTHVNVPPGTPEATEDTGRHGFERDRFPLIPAQAPPGTMEERMEVLKEMHELIKFNVERMVTDILRREIPPMMRACCRATIREMLGGK